jgi:hypothetical protein
MVIVGAIDRVREAKNTEGGRELEAFGRMISVAEKPSTEQARFADRRHQSQTRCEKIYRL